MYIHCICIYVCLYNICIYVCVHSEREREALLASGGSAVATEPSQANGLTPLHMAASSGDTELVVWLARPPLLS